MLQTQSTQVALRAAPSGGTIQSRPGRCRLRFSYANPRRLRRKCVSYRDRVLELRRVRAADIAGAPWNWRTHPPAQVEALAGSIEELGFFDPLDVRELPDGRL